MALAPQKITSFPSQPGKKPDGRPDVQREPASGSRSPITELEDALREARRNQRVAEDECDRLRRRVSEFTEAVGDVDAITLVRELEMLRGQQSQYGPTIADLKARLKAAEAARQNTRRESDDGANAVQKALKEKENAVKATEEANRALAATIRQRDLAKREKDEALEKAAAAAGKFSEAQKALAELRKDLDAARREDDGNPGKQVASLRQARDGMAAQIKELQHKVEELEDLAAELTYSRDAAVKESLAQTAKLDELHELRAQVDAITQQRDAATVALDNERAALVAAQEQIEAGIRERDAVRNELSEGIVALEAQLKEQAGETARLKDELARTAARLAEKENLDNQFEKRRLEIIEVTAQFASAQRDIRKLSADLAEARLQAKLNARKAGTPASSAQSPPKAAPAVAEPSPGSGADPCNDAAGNEAVLALRRCFQNISREPSKPGLLDELQTRAQSLADTGRDEGHPLLHRICTAFVALLADLRQLSQPISQGTLRTMNQTTELIASLLMDPAIEQKVSLDRARAYVVDDDHATCTTVTTALETVGLKTDHALYSSEAVAQLAGNQYDLIILDIHLPDLDGFELCAHIRNMALHAETPVFFISGNTSLENRVKSTLRGGNEFIGKPFSIQELALKSLKAVIKTQLHDR